MIYKKLLSFLMTNSQRCVGISQSASSLEGWHAKKLLSPWDIPDIPLAKMSMQTPLYESPVCYAGNLTTATDSDQHMTPYR